MIVPKESSLKKTILTSKRSGTKEESGKSVMRKCTLLNDTFSVVTTYSTRNDACTYLAKVPRTWITKGFLIIPSLSDKGIRGSFELEVYCSEPFSLRMLQDSFARCMAGEWVEGAAGGSHLCPSWKKNPKFNLKLRSLNDVPVKVYLSLTRHGEQWKKMCRRDTVGCMIGFYIFVNRSGELTNLFETPFVPTEEVCTPEEFTLEPLGEDEFYTIMPTTYSENHLGAFVLTVATTDCEFTLIKEGSSHHQHK